jgi:hypothetical protein
MLFHGELEAAFHRTLNNAGLAAVLEFLEVGEGAAEGEPASLPYGREHTGTSAELSPQDRVASGKPCRGTNGSSTDEVFLI